MAQEININVYVLKVKSFFNEMTDTMLAIYAEKGIEPFKKPLLITVPLILVLYVGVYSPLRTKIEWTANEVEKNTALSEGAGDYSDAKTRLAGFQRRLPLIKEKDDWLTGLLTNTAKAHNISFDALNAQTEEEAGNFLMVSKEVQLVTDYATLWKWIADLENSPIYVRIVVLNAEKDPDTGKIKTMLKLSTIFPKPQKGGTAAS